MILLISEDGDTSTNFVIDWLSYCGKKFIRINDTSKITFQYISTSNDAIEMCILKNRNEVIRLSSISSIWYRRGFIFPANINTKAILNANEIEHNLRNRIYQHLHSEKNSIIEYLHFLLTSKKSLGSIFHYQVNKLIALNIASSVGLDIPSTIITTEKRDIESYNHKFQLITKSIQEMLHVKIGSDYYCNYTEEVTNERMAQISPSFFPSLVQEKLDKLYELRIFYLNEVCYSMAIFSQQNQQTSVDFRKYSNEKPNRTVPYTLPPSVKKKLVILMKKLKLNCGSIDMVVTIDHKYVFLEVNPVGQFGMVSFPCNYNLEKKIAEYLSN